MNTKSRRKGPTLVTTSMRLERELLDEFRDLAESEYRSMNAEVRRLITEYVASRKTPA